MATTTTADAPPGRRLAAAAGVWAAFDVLVHVAIDRLEPLRISGNAVTIVAAALVGLGAVVGGRARWVSWAGAALVLALNVVWAVVEGALPVPAAVLVTGAVLMLAVLGTVAVRASSEAGR